MTADVIAIAAVMFAIFIYGMGYGYRSGLLKETIKRDEESPINHNISNSSYTK